MVHFAAVFGLFFLLFGNSVPYRNVEKQTPTAAGSLLFLVAAAASGFSFWWFKAQFDALGYVYGYSAEMWQGFLKKLSISLLRGFPFRTLDQSTPDDWIFRGADEIFGYSTEPIRFAGRFF